MGTSVELRAALPIADTLAAVRGAAADLVLLTIGPDVPAVERAMLIAALGPLAVELAPARRLCALDVAATADPDDVAAALAFLARAASTTGQVLAIA